MFAAMEQFGVPHEFIKVVRLVFNNARATVQCNRRESKDFVFEQGVREGCLLAPYLFLFIGEVFNVAVKQLLDIGAMQGISILDLLE